jgi:hypothetical protein
VDVPGIAAWPRRLRKEEIDPIIADLRRLTGWSEATVIDRLNLSKKKY